MVNAFFMQYPDALSSTLNARGGRMRTDGYTYLRFALRASQANQEYEVYVDSGYGQPLSTPVLLDTMVDNQLRVNGRSTQFLWQI